MADVKRNINLKVLFSVKASFFSILLIACITVVALAAMSLVQSRNQYQRRAEITTQNLCTVLSDNLITSYQKIDIAVLGVKDEVERELSSGGINGPLLESFIERRIEWIPVLFALRTADADGIIDHGNKVITGSRISIADRDYFLRLKSDPKAGLVFSKPLIGRVTGTWAVILARRINRRNGSFAGVAYGAIELEKVRTYFSSLLIGKEGTITLRESDFSIMVREGGSKNVTGQTFISPEVQELANKGNTSGTYTGSSPIDGITRIYSFVKIEPYGQYLTVGLGYDEVFAQWRRELYRTVGFVILFLILISGSTLLTYKAWLRKEQAEAEKERVIVELEKSLHEVKVLSGLIPICSNCKKIRDDRGYWNQIESYISSHSEAQFSHGICPDCAKLLYGEIFDKADPDSE